MSGTSFERHPREALDLTVRAVTLARAGAARPALLAAVDQARASLWHEPDPQVQRTLSWVCRAVLDPASDTADDAMVVDAALRVARETLAATAEGEV